MSYGSCKNCSTETELVQGAGHICKSCKAKKDKAYYEANKEARKAKVREYYHANKDKRKEYLSREEVKPLRAAYAKKYWAKAPAHVKENRRRFTAEWAEKNQGRRNAVEAKRRFVKERATPKWADLDAIREFYVNCPVGYEVDHIIPLKGKYVTGLHVLENLQYLTREENRKKSNKFPLPAA